MLTVDAAVHGRAGFQFRLLGIREEERHFLGELCFSPCLRLFPSFAT